VSTFDHLRSAAAEHAAALESDFVGTEHLFLAWLTTASGPIFDACSAAGLSADAFKELLAKSKPKRRGAGSPAGAGLGTLSSQAQRVMDLAQEIATEAGRDPGTADDVVLAMLREPRGAVARALTEFDLKPSKLRALVRDRPAPRKQERPAAEAAPAAPRERAPKAATPPPPKEGARPARATRGDESRADARRDARVPTPPVVPAAEPESAAVMPRLDKHSSRGFSPLAVLYLAIPVAIWLYLTDGPPAATFIAACLGVLPLAGLMGTATEQIAERTGPTLGGLLNATFGNAAELIIALAALRAGYLELVRASITGSILGNLLLILGLALIAGGTKKSMLRFNRTNAGMSAAMLALAVAGLVFPTLFHATHPDQGLVTELYFSEVVSGILIFTYLASLLFVLRTHRPLFGGGALVGESLEGTWSVGKAVAFLAVATIGVVVMSEILVHAVEPVMAQYGVSEVFLGLIIIPIIGNAAEHGTAVLAARKGQTDLAFQIALGSSTQIALLVAPILVFAGAFMGVAGMNLVFPAFEVIGLSVAVIISAIITLDGESHWFEGVQLLALYAMIGAAAWFI
jgi:Ca2+:H+ antiporter